MIWQLCIQYANGREKVLRSFTSQEVALQYVDAIYYVRGYPLHLAYVVRPHVIKTQVSPQLQVA